MVQVRDTFKEWCSEDKKYIVHRWQYPRTYFIIIYFSNSWSQYNFWYQWSESSLKSNAKNKPISVFGSVTLCLLTFLLGGTWNRHNIPRACIITCFQAFERWVEYVITRTVFGPSWRHALFGKFGVESTDYFSWIVRSVVVVLESCSSFRQWQHWVLGCEYFVPWPNDTIPVGETSSKRAK